MATEATISFNIPIVAGRELEYIRQAALEERSIGVNGAFTQLCRRWLRNRLAVDLVELSNSCTAAIEVAAELCDLSPGDEVVLPSFTHPSTANAFLARNAELRFMDIRPDTLCIDEQQVEIALNERTRVVVPVHYAGMCCDMDRLLKSTSRFDTRVIEDTAHAFGSKYRGRYLGTLGDFGVFSFHETKNIQCGAGGAVVAKQRRWIDRMHILLDKGTDRVAFDEGKVDAYTWQGWGSAYRLPELSAAYLWGQLENAEHIQNQRDLLYGLYVDRLADLARDGLFTLPSSVPWVCHNSHIFYLLLNTEVELNRLLQTLHNAGIQAVTHFVPLHLSPAGRRLGYRPGMLPVTENISERLLRLPLHGGLIEESIDYICSRIRAFFETPGYRTQALTN